MLGLTVEFWVLMGACAILFFGGCILALVLATRSTEKPKE
jgi:hypothetical protein